MSAAVRLKNWDFHREAGVFAPDRLTALRRIFDIVCEEAAIPPNATAERNEVANKILQASATIGYEPLLIAAARKAIAEYRR
jgi:hypothetical protein